MLDAGAEDASEEDGEMHIVTDPKELGKVRDNLKSAGVEILDAELTYQPLNTVEISDEAAEAKLMRLMEALEDLDDVVNTHTNLA